jgi:peptidoglycan/LPS O-acetylase OafA/YrhL
MLIIGVRSRMSLRTGPPRDARIDLLRGIAVSVVLLLHFSLTYRLPDSWLGEVFTPKGVARVVMNGNYGVTMFFVISGFLIVGNSLRRAGALERLDRKDFYVRRAARILPPLMPALVIVLVLGLIGQPSFVNRQHGEVMPLSFWWLAIGSVLTFWHNVLMQSEGYFNYALNIYWSLSVEEVFYLVFPWAALWLRRGGFQVLCCLLVVVGPLYRAMHLEHEVDHLYGYLACFDAIAIGGITALMSPHIELARKWKPLLTGLASVCLIVIYLAGIGGHEVLGSTGIACATAVLILARPTNAKAAPTGALGMMDTPLRLLRWMGRHSYELYLYHILVLGVMRDLMPRDALPAALKLPWLVLFLAVSMGVAFAVAHFLSEPLNARLRQRMIGAGK